MKRYKKKIPFILLTIAMLIALYLGIKYENNIEIYKSQLVIYNYYSTQKLNGSDALKLQEDNDERNSGGESFVVWGQEEIGELKNNNNNNIIEAPVILISGRSDILFPSTSVLDIKNTEQCLIGKTTAYKLFGGSNVKGLKINYGEKQFEIAGVLDTIDEIFVYEANATTGAYLNHINIQSSSQKKSLVGEKFTKNFPGIILEYDILLFLLNIVKLIIPVALGGHILRSIYSYIWESGKPYKEYVSWCICLIFVLCVWVWGIVHNLDFPQSLIPGKWSDFEFWTGRWKEISNSLKWIYMKQKTPIDLLFTRYYLSTFISYLSAAMLYFAIRKKLD